MLWTGTKYLFCQECQVEHATPMCSPTWPWPQPNPISHKRQGWECPKCGRVYSPITPECSFCNHQPTKEKGE